MKKCQKALVGILPFLFLPVEASEVLVAFEKDGAGAVERWIAEGDVWRKGGDFIPPGTVSPAGLACVPGTVLVADAPEGARTGRILKYSRSGECLGELVKTDYRPGQLLVSSDGWLLVSDFAGWRSCAYRISDGSSGACLPLGKPRMMAWGADGALCVRCSRHGRVEIHDFREGRSRGLLGTFTAPVMQGALAFAGRDGSRLVVPGNPTEVTDLSTGRLLAYPETVRFADCRSAVRIAGEVYAADAKGGFIARIPSEPGVMVKVAEGVPGIVAMLNVSEPAQEAFTTATTPFVREGPVFPTGYDYERLKFNNPGLTVELSLGVWPQVTVRDWSPKGGNDIAIEYGSTPSARACVYRNPTPPGERKALPVFKAPVLGRHPREAETRARPLPGLPRANPHANPRTRCTWEAADLNGDGRDDAVAVIRDTTAYPGGPSCPVAYRGENWTNGQYLAFFYWRENLGGEGAGTKWGPAHPLLVGGERASVPGPYGANASSIRDWDGDGDADILVMDGISQFWFYENRGTRTSPAFAAAQRLVASNGRLLEGELCCGGANFVDWDGDGLTDILLHEECGRVFFLRNAGRLDGHMPQFDAPVCFRQEADDLKFRDIPTPQGVDWDGDGDWDIITGDVPGYIGFIENLSGPGVEKPKWAEPKCLTVIDPENSAYRWTDGHYIHASCGIENSPQGPFEQKFGYTQPYVADWDGDGYLDVLANDVKGSVVWFRNPGRKGTTRLYAARPVEVEWTGPQPQAKWEWRKPPQGKELRAPWRTTPLAYDWNGDGLCDLIMLDHEGVLVLYLRERRDGRLALLPPKRVFADEKGGPLCLNVEPNGGSGRMKMSVCDWNGDGRPDILANHLNAQLLLNLGEKDGVWRFRTVVPLGRRIFSGHPCAPTKVDFDGNGIPDLLMGAEDGYFYYLRNPRANR